MTESTAAAATARATIDRATLETFVGQVAALVDEARIEFAPDGLHARQVDPANVAAVDVTLDADAFDSYETDDVTMGCNLGGTLADLLDDDHYDTFGLEFDAEAEQLGVDAGQSQFRIDTIDPDSIRAPHGEADVPWTATLTLPALPFARTVGDGNAVGNHITYGWDDDGGEFYATAEGDVHAYEYRTEAIDAEADDDAHSKFSLDYLRQRAPELPTTGTVEVRLGQGCPMLVEYEIADGAGYVEYLLAPRITGDDL